MPPQIDLARHYRPHAGQQKVHDAPARFKVLEVARRWGKSRLALFEMLKNYVEALDVPAPESLVPPWHAWVVCPSFPQARQTWNEMLSLIPRELVAPNGFHQNEMMVYLIGSEVRPWGFIEVKSANDPDSLQSVGLDFLWVNEAQDVGDRAFEKLLPTLRTPGRASRAVYEGIPSMYSDHWFRKMYVMAERGARDYVAFKATAFENPLLTPAQREEIEGDREVLTDAAWRRLYLAEFSASAGYFNNIDACIAGDLLPAPIPGPRYVAGLDLGRKIDASVLHVLDAVERKLVFHRSWDAGENWIIQREGIAHIAREWGLERLIMDATGMGGDIFTQELQEMGIPVEPFVITGGNGGSRDALLNTLAVAMERQTVSFPPVPSLLRQLRVFQYRKLPGGQYRAEAPPGEHDDEPFALALALMAADAPQAVMLLRGGLSRRYLPTQDEAMAGGVAGGGIGARIVAERRAERFRERNKGVALW